jgi:serine/threonine-protein kinase
MEIIGKLLGGRYEILEKIGEGGMATVYKAKCNLLNRYVAIKVLKSEYSKDDTFVKRFRAEAQSAASLTHPNIVSVYDVGDENGINYIVMELLESKTLKDYIEEKGALPNEVVLKITAQVASALEAAHKSHIIHRDIKPQNIILNKNMVAKVTDFGIAKITNAPSATITSFGSTMGSVHYFSPEHAKGGYTDEKSDIYSLGVVMYEMATGKLPFDAESPVSVALKHIQEVPVEPIIYNPKVSQALNEIILKAMSKSTTERYQNATELLRDISIALVKPNNTIISRAPSSIEAGATQVIPIIKEDEFRVPNLRTRESARRSSAPSTVIASRGTSLNYNNDNEEKVNVIQNKEKIEDNKELKDKQKKKKMLIIYIVCASIAVIGIGIFFGIKINNKIKADKTANAQITIPDLTGKIYANIVEDYAAKGIEITTEKTEYNSEQPEGAIISQTPEKDTLTSNKKITVVVSKGTKMVTVPDVAGKSLAVAKYELQDTLGFVIETEEVVSDKVLQGIIISQDPKKEESKPYGSTIKLTVSKGDGKAKVIMPTVLGKTEAVAKTTLTDLGLTVNVSYGEDNTKSNGVVTAQNYPQNQELKAGDLVTITVNKLMLSKTVTLDLLALQGGTASTADTIAVKVTASVDGGATNTVYDKSIAPSTASTTLSINGYTSAALKIYIDGVLKKEQTVNFQ